MCFKFKHFHFKDYFKLSHLDEYFIKVSLGNFSLFFFLYDIWVDLKTP